MSQGSGLVPVTAASLRVFQMEIFYDGTIEIGIEILGIKFNSHCAIHYAINGTCFIECSTSVEVILCHLRIKCDCSVEVG